VPLGSLSTHSLIGIVCTQKINEINSFFGKIGQKAGYADAAFRLKAKTNIPTFLFELFKQCRIRCAEYVMYFVNLVDFVGARK
jgi:hypothetical protein